MKRSAGLRCACAQGSLWQCAGVALEGAAPAAATADVQAALLVDELQGVDDELRDRFGKAHARMERLEGLLRWAANAKAVLSDAAAQRIIRSINNPTRLSARNHEPAR